MDHAAKTPPFDFLVVVDFEATADEGNPPLFPRDEVEIIEFPWVVIDARSLEIVYERQIYVRPEKTPLTPFCTQLTGITQDKLDSGVSLQTAVEAFDQYVTSSILDQGRSFCFVTDGAWDLEVQLARECREKGIDLKEYFARYFDLKTEFVKWNNSRASTRSQSPTSSPGTESIPQTNGHGLSEKTTITGMSVAFNLPVHGRLHSGIDDCKTIGAICVELLKQGLADLFCAPEDRLERLHLFEASQGAVLSLRGVPFSLNMRELRAWLAEHGCPPASTAYHMLCDTDRGRRPSGTVYAIFETHEHAGQALALNGRVIQNRYILMRPATTDEFQQANKQQMREDSNPLMRPEKQFRAGDWICPNCTMHNFSYRTECFRCSQMNPLHLANAALGAAAAAAAQVQVVRPGSGDHSPTLPGTYYSGALGQTPMMMPQAVAYDPAFLAATTQQYPYYPGVYYVSRQGYPSVAQTIASAATNGQTSPVGLSPPSSQPVSPGRSSSGAAPQPIRPGDWICPNPACMGHNFARREECRQCGMPRYRR